MRGFSLHQLVLRPTSAVGAVVASLLIAGGLSACQDPCTALAERICACEPSAADVAACRLDRITNQSGRVAITDADREVCGAKLDTCTCRALDVNDLDACGFAPAEPAASAALTAGSAR